MTVFFVDSLWFSSKLCNETIAVTFLRIWVSRWFFCVRMVGYNRLAQPCIPYTLLSWFFGDVYRYLQRLYTVDSWFYVRELQQQLHCMMKSCASLELHRHTCFLETYLLWFRSIHCWHTLSFCCKIRPTFEWIPWANYYCSLFHIRRLHFYWSCNKLLLL